MPSLSLTKLALAAGGLALSLTAGVGVASADPDLTPIINTTCTYPQAMAALNAQDPAIASRFSSSPLAQSWLRSFLSAPPDQRERMIQQLRSMPESQQYTGLVLQVANTCNNY
ncbi:hemophore-related protein [Mycobacterium sp.]|uniref:hemophore-related protein n=1 Tax=Mycobacterium sp. TaxID=1785 RepID=UPI0031E46B28